MRMSVSRAVMALAICALGESRREWARAMRVEFDAAAEDGRPLLFALGCLAAAGRELLTREEGRFVLTNYALALGLMLPMAALQIGCALLGLPYLYGGQGGLRGALIDGGTQELLLRSVYQAAVPSLSLLLLLVGIGHLRIAWAMLERDWSCVMRMGSLTLAAAATLILFMAALFLDGSQALLQATILAIELATVAVVARWHAQLAPPLAEDLAR
ncbi:hypothetical protein RZN05_01360 [Sphingomonas sp. HF-S4]|uniref:Uncharacterized protein n=1 Tax=Sphingomonas agrestis TaxID=3080540 RepID=A0ABU3Y2M7_9SPHN|nr:hypothetical protein [Sphingomonas sp. HF-S4]MDV3455615.1 hypothetical protein [Sphingomonas sp. HF-S4]